MASRPTFFERLKRAILCSADEEVNQDTGQELCQGIQSDHELSSTDKATRETLHHGKRPRSLKKQTSQQAEQRNILVFPLLGEKIKSCSIIANHILQEERIEPLEISTTFAVALPNCEVTLDSKSYSFTVATVIGGGKINVEEIMRDAADTVPRYAKGLHLVIFVTSSSSLLNRDDAKKHRSSVIENSSLMDKEYPSSNDDDDDEVAVVDDSNEYTIQYFFPKVQSISLLVIIRDDDSVTDESLIHAFKSNCGSYKMKKGIIPVSLDKDDTNNGKIKEDDEGKLLNLICHCCKHIIPNQKVFPSAYLSTL